LIIDLVKNWKCFVKIKNWKIFLLKRKIEIVPLVICQPWR